MNDRTQPTADRALEIREARPEEYGVLGEITVAAYLGLDASIDANASSNLSDDYLARLRDVADRAAKAIVLAAVDPEPLGCVTYVPGLGEYAEFKDADAAGIRMLAVAPAARSKGVGRALTQACLDRARADGFRLLVLHTMASAIAARHLYENMGFARASERDWYPEPDVFLMGYEYPLR